MDALEAILSRKVQRTFADKLVERDKLAKIVDAGRHAMSARNMQPWQFVVIQNRDALKEIGALCSTGKFVTDAPSIRMSALAPRLPFDTQLVPPQFGH